MFRIFLVILTFGLLNALAAQVPGEVWTRKYVESTFLPTSAYFFDGYRESNGRYVLAGGDTNWTYDRTTMFRKLGMGRAAIIKTDPEGNLLWKYSSSGNVHPGGAGFAGICPSPEAGSLAVGYQHVQCCATIPRDMLVAKISATGKEVWIKRISGNSDDILMSVANCSTGGYIMTGYSASTDGSFSGNKGANDIWLIRMDEAGTVRWMKNYGGTRADSAWSVIQTPDRGFLVAGATASVDGDFSGTGGNGSADGFVMKLDSSGNILWRKRYGGDLHDGFSRITRLPGDGYLVTGYAFSPNASANGNKGGSDTWVVRLDAGGNSVWSKTFGGTSDDAGHGLQFTASNGSLVVGYTLSNNGDVRFNKGKADAWLLHLDGGGNLVWEKTVGTNEDDIAFVPYEVKDGVYSMIGTSHYPAGNFAPNWATLSLLGNANTARGTVYIDWNANGTRDPIEPLAEGVKVTAVKSGQQEKFAWVHAGNYSIDIDTGAHTFSAALPGPSPYFTFLPASRTTSRSTYYNIDTIDFRLTPKGRIRDGRIAIVPVGPARPGFNADYEINYANVGTDTVPFGYIRFVVPAKMQFLSASPAHSLYLSDTVQWNFSNLKPFDKAKISLRLKASSPPTLNMGDTLRLGATFFPVAGDATPADDTSILAQRLVGSFDPNDKNDDLAGGMPLNRLQQGKDIGYLIRFQNTGTDTAYRVQIRDTLDGKLDAGSFQMVAASHPYSVKVEGGNRITWTFEPIRLPDSNRNEPASHGYVMYRVKPISSLSVGEIIRNAASIYFDYNLPVRTNIQSTVITNAVVTSLSDILRETHPLSLFPNPTSGKVAIRLDEDGRERVSISVVDMTGAIVRRSELGVLRLNGFRHLLNLEGLKPGVYHVQLQAGKRKYSGAVMVW